MSTYHDAVRVARDLLGAEVLPDDIEDAVRCDESFVELALAREQLRRARRAALTRSRETEIQSAIETVDDLALDRLVELLGSDEILRIMHESYPEGAA